MTMDPLADLRDWHFPEPVSWWPPAPGWWLLTAVFLLLAVWLARRLVRRHRQGAPARRALLELSALRAGLAASGDTRAYAAGLSGLLRRLALARFPRDQVAGLIGQAWLDFLDATGGGKGFRQGPGQALAGLAFDGDVGDVGRPDPDALAELVATWIRANRNPERQASEREVEPLGHAGRTGA
jgi:hypothetical protein